MFKTTADEGLTEFASPASPLRILLLEDNRFDAEITIEHLRMLDVGCVVTAVDKEHDFVAALQAGGVDLVLSDFALPCFSGTEALAICKRLAPDLPFVFVSGVLGEENAVDMLKLGATDYVVKSRLGRLPFVVDRAISEARERRQRIEVERALQSSEYLFTRVVESLKDYAFILLSSEGQITNWTGAAQTIFGYSAWEAIGQNASLLYKQVDREDGALAAQLHNAVETGRASDDRWLVRKDGQYFYANAVITALMDEKSDERSALIGFSLIVRDGTEARYAAEALEAAKMVAEQANQAKSRFLAVLSHELRTPLTPILAAAEILEMRLDVPPALAKLLPMIRRNVALEARLIDDLLDLTSIERDKLVLNMRNTDLHTALRNALDMLRDDIAAKRLKLNVHLDAEVFDVHGDEARLQQIFWNLLRNAVKFTSHDGSIVVHSRNPDAESVEVSVSDSGIGICEDALTRIFSQFEQADPSISKTFGGLGLGLAIARALAMRHGGQLTAASDGEGKGAKFTLRLPLRSATQRKRDDMLQAEPAEALPRAPESSCRILLVEDSVDAAEALRYSLHDRGYEVIAVHSVAAARVALQGDSFDLLVSDIGLPDGTGYDVIAETGGRLPAIALSGYGMRSDTSRSEASGFFRHIVKPVDHVRLDDAIQDALRAKRGGGAALQRPHEGSAGQE